MSSLHAIQKSIGDFKKAAIPLVDRLRRQADEVTAACEAVGRSWSGSFAGYHGRLYYRDFQAPPLRDLFSPEWGGIRGIPDGWDQRSAEQVRAEIERLFGNAFSIEEMQTLNTELAERAADFRTHLLDELSATQATGGSDRDKRLLTEIEQLQFGKNMREYVLANLPKSLMTRDSQALMQGICTPSDLYYEGVAYEVRTSSDAVKAFVKLLERLELYIDRAAGSTKSPVGEAGSLRTLNPDILAKCQRLYDDGAYAEAVEKSFKIVKDRLRKLTGYESGADAFGKGKLHVRGAAAPNVDRDFNEGVKFLLMAIDYSRNEKSHTADAKIADPIRAYEYLRLSSLALNVLDGAEVLRPVNFSQKKSEGDL